MQTSNVVSSGSYPISSVYQASSALQSYAPPAAMIAGAQYPTTSITTVQGGLPISSSPATMINRGVSGTAGLYSSQMYQPQAAVYVPFGQPLSAGMQTTYDQRTVPTFEAPLLIQGEPTMPRFDLQERKVSMSEVSFQQKSRGIDMDSKKKSVTASKKASKKPQKSAWCCY